MPRLALVSPAHCLDDMAVSAGGVRPRLSRAQFPMDTGTPVPCAAVAQGRPERRYRGSSLAATERFSLSAAVSFSLGRELGCGQAIRGLVVAAVPPAGPSIIRSQS